MIYVSVIEKQDTYVNSYIILFPGFHLFFSESNAVLLYIVDQYCQYILFQDSTS
jgi:hypothetical protein